PGRWLGAIRRRAQRDRETRRLHLPARRGQLQRLQRNPSRLPGDRQMKHSLIPLMLTVAVAAWPASVHARTDTRCIVASGVAATRCVRRYAEAIAACRTAADAACEQALRAPAGELAALAATTEKPVRDGCTPAAADVLTSSLGVDDLVSRTAQ